VTDKESKYKRIDWPAVQRDYRPGNLTQQELAAKHKLNEATLCRKIKADRAKDPSAWPQDLTELVKQATDARLMAELVKGVAKDGQEQAKTTVLAAAELNAQVILRHRGRLEKLNADADHARAKLIELAAGIADIKEAATYVSALEASARTAKIVIEAERKAYNLDDDSKDKDRGGPVVVAAQPLDERI
jgi:hypothetical protein